MNPNDDPEVPFSGVARHFGDAYTAGRAMTRVSAQDLPTFCPVSRIASVIKDERARLAGRIFLCRCRSVTCLRSNCTSFMRPRSERPSQNMGTTSLGRHRTDCFSYSPSGVRSEITESVRKLLVVDGVSSSVMNHAASGMPV